MIGGFKEFAYIQVYPGDTTANLHTRLMNDIRAAKPHYGKYPHLWTIPGFNDYLK